MLPHLRVTCITVSPQSESPDSLNGRRQFCLKGWAFKCSTTLWYMGNLNAISKPYCERDCYSHDHIVGELPNSISPYVKQRRDQQGEAVGVTAAVSRFGVASFLKQAELYMLSRSFDHVHLTLLGIFWKASVCSCRRRIQWKRSWKGFQKWADRVML